MSKSTEKFVPPVFHDREESYDIEETVNKIQEQRIMFKPDEMKQMYLEFATDNPELFKKCCNEILTTKERGYVVFLLTIRRRVKNKEITFQEANNIVSVYFAEQIQPELLTKDGFNKK